MKMKKLSLIILSLLLTAPAVAAKTSVTPFIAVESNEYDSGDNEKIDDIYSGVSIKTNFSDTTQAYFRIRNYDYDYFGSTADEINDEEGELAKKKVDSKQKTEMYLYNKIQNLPKNASLNLGLGVLWESSNIQQYTTNYYYFQPRWGYKVSDDLSVYGSWSYNISNKDKYQSKGDDYLCTEMETGVKYKGIDNYTVQAGLFNYYYGSLEKDDDESKVYYQLRAKVSTKVLGVGVTPWTRIGLGEWQYTDSDGEDVSDDKGGYNENTIGLDLSKKINDVKYKFSTYFRKKSYSKKDDSDINNSFVQLSATYTFE